MLKTINWILLILKKIIQKGKCYFNNKKENSFLKKLHSAVFTKINVYTKLKNFFIIIF